MLLILVDRTHVQHGEDPSLIPKERLMQKETGAANCTFFYETREYTEWIFKKFIRKREMIKKTRLLDLQ